MLNKDLDGEWNDAVIAVSESDKRGLNQIKQSPEVMKSLLPPFRL